MIIMRLANSGKIVFLEDTGDAYDENKNISQYSFSHGRLQILLGM